jgi:N-acetylneuraminate lyase
MKPRLNGLIAAPFTPFLPDGGLNLSVIQQQADSLAANGVTGAFICGTTGEGLSLTTAERMQVAERWVAAAARRLKVIVHVGHNSLGDSQELAGHAEQVGADAFATMGPTFFLPAGAEQLADFCARMAKAAPSLPFYYYHLPAMTGVNMPMIEFLKCASQGIPNFAGVKFTDEDLMSYSQCLNFEDGRFDILFGRDEILLAALALGAIGAVGSTYNYMAPLYHQLRAAFERGDLETARRHQFTAMHIITVMNRHGGLPAGKAMMGMVGIDCGPVRPPLRNLSPGELEALRRELQQTGFPLPVMKSSRQPAQAAA